MCYETGQFYLLPTVGLNQANKIRYIELVALGSSNMTSIKPREAFRMAIYKLAIRVVMIRNHPRRLS